MNKPERIGTLMFRYARKELTRKEKKELTCWRRAHPEKEDLFRNSTDPECLMVDVGAFLSYKEKGLQKLKEGFPEIWKDSPDSRHYTRYWMIGIAGFFMIGLSLILFFLFR